MDSEEFRRRGHALVDWIAAYHDDIERLPVMSRVEPGQVRDRLPRHPPKRGESFDKMFADFERDIMPGVTHWQSPNWFAFFPANVSYPSILGDLLSSGLGVQGMMWLTSPACTELETHVLDWTAELLELPRQFRGNGVIHDTASSAALCALIAARERATGGRSNRSGCDGRLTVYASQEAHSSIEKAAGIAGIGRLRLRKVEVDVNNAMRASTLSAMIDADVAAGYDPCFVCATVGTTASNAIDPVREIGEVCLRYGVWLHVDAAMSGTAAVCPEFRWIHDGLDLANSYNFNPHKWMLTNFDCSALWVSDRDALVTSLSIQPDYLRNDASDGEGVIDYRDWQIPLGRRFRALKLWFVIRAYGVEGLQELVRRHVALAQDFAARVDGHPDFVLAAPTPLNLVCFRHRRGDAFNKTLLERLNGSGELAMSHTRLDGRFTLRFCVGQAGTESHHVDAAWKLIQETADTLA